MARIRSTHPGQWRDQDFVECSFPARLLALALRNEADDSGIFEWKPKQIKMSCFPADSVDIDALLSEIVAAHIVLQYEIDGRQYGAIRNFRLYQRPKTPNALHPVTDEIRKYVGMKSVDFGNGSEITLPEPPPITETPRNVSETVPKSAEQVEEVGCRVKEVKEKSSLRSDSVRPTDLHSDGLPDPPSFLLREKVRKRRLPDGFEPNRENAIAYWTRKERADLCRDVEDQVTQFRAHHRKCGSQWEDWDSAWVTWYSKAPEMVRPRTVEQSPETLSLEELQTQRDRAAKIGAPTHKLDRAIAEKRCGQATA